MYYISLKQQAKIITTNSSPSSTELTNKEKKLVSKGSRLPSNYFWPLKKLVSKRPGFPSNYFFYYKKQQATSNKQAASSSLSLYFFLL